MQYLLTQDEFNALAPRADLDLRDLALETLRRKVLTLADHPCIHDMKPNGERRGGYCDGCPLSSLRVRTPERDLLCTKMHNYSK